MATDIVALVAEVQVRCDALTNGSTNMEVLEVGIAAKKVEMAGGIITRTILDAQLQRLDTASDSGSSIKELIVLAAAQEVPVDNAASVPVGTYVTGLFGGKPEYLCVNGGTYLKSAYPDLDSAMLSGLTQQVYTTAATPVVATNIGAVGFASTPAVMRYVDIGSGAVYLVGGSCPYTVQNVGGHFTRIRSASGANPWALQYSVDGGTTLVDHTDRLQPVADSLAGGPGGNNAVSAFCVDDIYINGTTVVVAGRVSLGAGPNYYVYAAVSQDSGLTFQLKQQVSCPGYSVGQHTYRTPQLVGIGATVVLAPRQSVTGVEPRYSMDSGATWTTISSGAADSGGKTIADIKQNGSCFNILFTNGTSAYTPAADPAAGNWVAVAAMPSVGTLVGGGVVGTKFIATGVAGYVATCSALGTWVYQGTLAASLGGITVGSCAVLSSTLLFTAAFVSGSSAAGQGYYCTDSGTLPAATAIVADDNMTCPSLLAGGYAVNGAFHMLMANRAIVKSTTLTSTSWTIVQCPMQSADAIPLLKYGCMFFQVDGKRFVSYDNGVTLRPAAAAVTEGQGIIIDAGSRLLALDAQQLLWQSTDGKTWNTTGLTRPTIASTPVLGSALYASLEVCGSYIYYIACRNNSEAYTYVSSTAGSTWTATTLSSSGVYDSFAGALYNTRKRFYLFNGVVYFGYLYGSRTYYMVQSASNGIAFSTFVANAATPASSVVVGFLEYAGSLYWVLGDVSLLWSIRVSNTGAAVPVLGAANIPAVVVTLATMGGLCDIGAGAGQRWYTMSTTNTVVYNGTSLTRSSTYQALAPVVQVMYDSVADGVRAWGGVTTIGAAPRNMYLMPDDADSFTLPNIANTWLRAAI